MEAPSRLPNSDRYGLQMIEPGSAEADLFAVKIHLKDLQSRESFPDRIVYLFAPTFDLKIGRGSQTETNLHPQKSNAWFTSRVMSREHAILRADPLLRRVYLEDTGSMHGTYIEGARLGKDLPMEIKEHETIQFGTEIIRGDQTYDPLELSLQSINWSDASVSSNLMSPDGKLTSSRFPPLFPKSRSEASLLSKNSFSVDYSDDEDAGHNQDVEVLYQSTVSKLQHGEDGVARTFSVPDTDESVSSDVDREGEQDSLPSSLAASPDMSYVKTMAITTPTKIAAKSRLAGSVPKPTAPGSTFQNALPVSDDEDDKDNGINNEVVVEDIQDADVDDNDDDEHQFLEEEMDDCNEYCSEDEYIPDEDEEQIFNDIDGNCPSIVGPQTTTDSLPRAPSPSDAAMPKSCWYAPGSLPAIQNLVEQSQQQSSPFSETFSAGPQHLPHFQPISYYTAMTWPINDGNPSFPAPYESFQVSPPTVQQKVQQTISQSIPSLKQQEQVESDQPGLVCGTGKDNVLAKTSKVSIHDIIENIGQDHTGKNGARKRKAGDISVGNDSEAILRPNRAPTSGACCVNTTAEKSTADSNLPSTDDTGLRPSVLAVSNVVSEKSPSGKKSVTFSPDTVIIEPNSERPRKRVKHHQEGQGSNFYKYVATALAGVTFGAVSTVFGLAALPADYFA